MNRYIVIDPRARRDLDRIWNWLNKRSPRGAISWYRAFWNTATRIASDADGFALADEASKLMRDVRQVIFKTRSGRRYRIIFGYSNTEVFILRVRQPGQRPLRRRDMP